MATGDQVVFRTRGPTKIPTAEMTKLPLISDGASTHLRYDDDAGIVFTTQGWYEVLLRVDWDPTNTTGTRFAHTKIPDQEPLHSEAIAADVLSRISDGRQLLRGNTVFGLDSTTSVILEVWHDADQIVEVGYAELAVRELDVPD